MTTDSQQFGAGLHQEELYGRLGWLIRLRWLAALGLLATVILAQYGLGLQLALVPLLALNGLLVVCNTAYWLLWRRQADAPADDLVRFGVVQTVLDYAILTVVLHYSGGVENPLIVTFVFQCIIASMLFSPRLSYLSAAVAIVMVTTMVVLELTDIWPHQHLQGYLGPELAHRGLFVVGVLVTLAVVLLVSVYLTTTIEEASRQRSSEVARHSRELEEAREQMQQADKMAALGELAAGMAHDINNPAGVICSRLDVMEAEGALEGLPDRLCHDLKTLRECAEYLRRVTNNWTRFMRKAAPRMGRINLNEAVQRTANMTIDTLRSNRIQQRFLRSETPLWVYGDLVRLQQVVLNLINNARDAMGPGGSVTIQTRLESGADCEPRAVIEVEDTGSGISEEDLEHIFDPFFSKKSRKQEGTGLGLVICRKIVQEMEGKIDVRSQVGVGTVFSIRLPLIEGETEPRHAQST